MNTTSHSRDPSTGSRRRDKREDGKKHAFQLSINITPPPRDSNKVSLGSVSGTFNKVMGSVVVANLINEVRSLRISHVRAV